MVREADINESRGEHIPVATKGQGDTAGNPPRPETVTVNRHLYRQIQQFEHMLIGSAGLEALLSVLLNSLPRHFALPACELWLYDPGEVVTRLLDDSSQAWPDLKLMQDAFELDELYESDPQLTVIDATDSRMFEVLKAEEDIAYALLMPLFDEGKLIGSLHWGLEHDASMQGDANNDMVAHLGSIISLCFQNAVNRQRLSRFNLIDPLTEIGNRRGFEIDISREIDRARREQRPLSLLLLEIDQYADLQRYHGTTTCEYVVRKLAERIASNLRSTDWLARFGEARMAALLPGSGAVLAEEIAERMRRDVEDLHIDDGRGAVMYATLSGGVATWEPVRYPARDMHRLARQLETAAEGALRRALRGSGNAVAVARLGPLII